ncbi:MAG: FkbM family methyltransferase [Ignavibacteria bacterium]|nr:FkbM family methyltransferase [Ignavibacteria bacterium]
MKPEEIYKILEEQYFGEHSHEQKEIQSLQQLLSGVKTFIDVGASLGQYTYYANKFIQNGKIISIEADPVRYKRLSEQAAKWEKESTNKIEVIYAAVSDTIGKTKFFISNSNISGGLFTREIHDAKTPDWEEITVNCITLDSLLNSTIPDFIKIDVEGGEYRVINGSQKLLQQTNVRFLMEIHGWADKEAHHAPEDVFDIFKEHSFAFKKIHSHILFKKKENLSLCELFAYFQRKSKYQLKLFLRDTIRF